MKSCDIIRLIEGHTGANERGGVQVDADEGHSREAQCYHRANWDTAGPM